MIDKIARMRYIRAGFDGKLVDYRQAWEQQRQIHAAVSSGGESTTLLVQHEPVYTAGRRTASWDRPTNDTPVIDVDRGGRITWHGPGQIVGYPIMRLPEPVDVVGYVRTLEECLIEICRRWGITAAQVEGRSGVWIPRSDAPWAKIAAIGVRVAKGVTMHGFALNVSCDLSWFNPITPCGISDADVTSIAQERGAVTPAELLDDVEFFLSEHLNGARL